MMIAPWARSVTRRHTRSGTSSSRTQNAPASSSRRASSTIRFAAAALLPCSRNPPRALALCGVSPRWPMTGIPARAMPATRSAMSAPPSSLTASQPVSAMNRPALRIAVSVLGW